MLSQRMCRQTCARFYRATCMHSAVYAVARCLSVRPSHADILSTPLNIILNFLPSGSSTILVSVPDSMAIFWRETIGLTGASNARGYENIAIFDQYLALSPKWCQLRAVYGRRIWNRTQAFEWCHFQWPWSSDPNLDFKVTILFNVK